MFLQELA